MKKLVVGTLLLLMALAMDTACAEETPCFGPRQYMRTQGKPDLFTERIASCSGTATVKVINGEPDGTRRISSAEIKVNGVPIFSPRDFNQNIHVITTQILLEADNTLTVALRSGGGKAQGGDLFRFPIVHSTLRGRIWHSYLDKFLKWCGFGKPGSKTKPEAPYLTIAIFGPSEPTWPPPTATLAASPMSITAGHPVTLAWTTTDAETCAIEPGLGSVAANGILELFPHETMTYTLVATGPGGTISADATVTVESPPPLLNVRIAKPAEGDVIPARTITVTGTVSVSDVAVAVNGIPALVMDGIFIAENIALEFGDNTLIVTAIKGDDHAEHRISVHVPGIDLVPVEFDLVAYNLDQRSLKLDGTAHIVIANQGTGDLTGAFFLVLFEDTDGDGRFDYETDNLLAEVEVPEGLPAGDVAELLVDFRGQSHFRDNPLHLFLDSHDAIEETDKHNNLASVERIGVDVSASYPRVDNASCPDAAVLTVRIGNAGRFELASGLPVAFYDGDPREGGMHIGTAWSTTSLLPGGFEDVSLTWPDADSLGPVFAMADDDGTGKGFYSESDTDNNLASAAVAVCSGPQATPDSISGLVKDALTGLPLQGAVIALQREVDGAPGSLVHQLETPADGGFLFADLPPGAYYLSASLDGYIDARRRVIVDADQNLAHRHLVLSPLLASDQIRIVLTWGEHPRDLDAHLTGPNPDGCRHHCNYWNRLIPGAQLDRDDTLGFGPETITLTKGTEGTFRYYVHDFTHRNIKGSALAASEARVVVHFGTGADPLVFEVPPQAGTVWHVFEIDGLSGQLTAVNRMVFQSESGKIDFPVFTSTPPTSVTWGTPYVYEIAAEDPDNDPLTFSLLESPSGMHLDPYTGILQWDPDTWQGGSHKVTLQVSDGRCGRDTQSFFINVSHRPIAELNVYPCNGHNPGGRITLEWSTRRAETVTIEPGIGPVATSGTLSLDAPETPKTFQLTAINAVGQTIRQAPRGPSAKICMNTDYFEESGIRSSTLTWEADCADACFIAPHIGAVPCAGATLIDPDGPRIYYLTARNATQEITVDTEDLRCEGGDHSQLSTEPVCDWSPGDPVLLDIIQQGAVLCRMDQDVGDVPCHGSVEVRPEAPTTYTLTVTRIDGTMETRTITAPVILPPRIKLFSSARSAIQPGESLTLNWDTECVLSCVIAPGIGPVDPTGALTVTPEALPQTYTLTGEGDSENVTATVTITHVPPAISFRATPPMIKPGETATLVWAVDHGTSWRIEPDIGPVTASGSIEVQPARRTTYTLTAEGPGGSRTRTATVSFVKPTVQIQAAPQVLAPGQGTTLTWLFTDADTCHLSSNFGLSVEEMPLGGNLDVVPDRPTRYTLACTGPGGTVSDSLTVSFVAPEVAISAAPVAVAPGQAATLSWESFFAENCAILPGIGAVTPNGSIAVAPSDSTTYTITATGPGGTAAAGVTVDCIEPVIQFGPAFQAIPLGEDTALTWNVPNGETIRIDPLGLMPAAGSITVSPTETTEYTIRIAGCGRTITTTATVQVLCPPSLTFITPGPSDTFADTDFLLRWVIADCGNNAATALYYLADSGDTLIASGVQRNPDGTAQYLWDTAAVPEGTYHIFAVLDDGHHAPVTVHAGHPVIIDHSAPPMPWITLAASDGGAYDAFSSSLSLSEKHAVVGAPNNGEDRNGAVYLFEREGGTWTETAKLECPPDRDCRSFGSSLAIDGETLVVGASSGSWNDAEPSFIFSLHDGKWIQQGALFPEAGGRYNEFGRSVVVGGDTVLIGAPGWSEGASGGAVYPFNGQDGAWTEQPRLLPGSNNTALQFGYSLWLEGDSLIVGTSPYQVADSPIPPVAERVLFFQRAGDGWHVDATLMGMDSTGLEHGARFGTAVHLNGNTAIVGSPQAENYHGAAYLFERDVHSGEWTPTARLLAGDSAHGGKFGTSVWIDGDYAYVGTGYSDYHSQNPGDAVYIFRHQDGNWGEQHKIRPGNNLPKIGFGENIAVANGRLLVSAAQARQDDTPVGRAYLYTTCAADLAVSPSAIAPGATATLSWRTELADTITIEPGIGSVDPNGAIQLSPGETTTYTLYAAGPYGRTSRQVTLRVGSEAPAVTLSAAPTSVTAGQSSTLTWHATNATEVTIAPGIGPVPPEGTMAVTPVQTTTYTITATGPGGTVNQSIQVIVAAQPETSACIEAEPADIAPGQVTVLSWTTTHADTVTIEPDIGAVAPAGSIAVSPSATTTYIVTATGPLGTAAAGVTVAVTTGDHINVQITSPNAGDTIPKPYTMVEGMIANHQGLETGVTVNGVPAVVYGDMFIVNHIALAPGENTLTAIATDTAGHTAAARVTVDRDPDQPYIRLEARPVTGASPLESTLTLSGSFMIDETVSHAITGWSLTHAAPGEVKIHNTAAGQYSLHISGEGIYYFRAEVEDADQNRLTDTIAIVVLEEAGLDALLQGKWTGMKQALAERDIDGALNHFDPEMQGLYHDIYTALYDDLPAMAAAMQAIELVEIGENHARYRIRKEENYSGDRVTITYYIYFARDDQGIWRIYRY